MRSYWVYRTSEILVNIAFRTLYKVHFEGSFPEGPFVLLPKHQKMLDILLEGNLIYRSTGKQPYFVMRGFSFPLNHLLQLYGGVLLARPKDLRKGKITKDEAKDLNERTATQASELLKKGQIVIAHPEGTRVKGQIGPIKMAFLEKIISAETGAPFVVMGIEYSGRNVYVQIGTPFYATDGKALEQHIRHELPRLSGL